MSCDVSIRRCDTAQFIAAYAKKGDDGKYHIAPTVAPENFGLTVDFWLNWDCIVDLALSAFLFDAVVSVKVLNIDAEEREQWAEVRSNLVLIRRREVRLARYGWMWTMVPRSRFLTLQTRACRSFLRSKLESGCDLSPWRSPAARLKRSAWRGEILSVFQPLMRARLGILDLNWFKSEVRYCLLPNGIANDRARQEGGRYSDETDFDFMMRMAVWVENFSLPEN